MYLNDYQTLLLLSRFKVPVVPYFLIDSLEKGGSLFKKHELTRGVVQEEGREDVVCETKEELEKRVCDACARNRQLLVRPVVDVDCEIYLAVLLDATLREHVVLTARGRVHERSQMASWELFKESIPVGKKLYTFQKNSLFRNLELPEAVRASYFLLLDRLLELYFSQEALLIEINPLLVTVDSKLCVPKAIIQIDDYALFRHSEMSYFSKKNEGHTKKQALSQQGLSYGSQGGDLGVLAVGDDFLFALFDLIKKKKGSIGSFISLPEREMEDLFWIGLQALLEDQMNALLISFFVGVQNRESFLKKLMAFLNTSHFRPIPLVLYTQAVSMSSVDAVLSSFHWPITVELTVDKAVSEAVQRAREMKYANFDR